MRFRQVVVVTKFHHRDLSQTARQIHRDTLKAVLKRLKAFPFKLDLIDRNKLTKPLETDLIITVGGDGTALAASHFADHAPLLGVNSAPQTSTGFFCLAGPGTFPRHLKAILSGKRLPVFLPRLEVTVNGKKLPYPALNELLFASKLQGETTRYRLAIGKREESQKSSGVWAATGAGSTAAIYSAGGKKDSPFSKRLQYWVREPFRFPKNRYRLLKGFLKQGQKLTIVSEIHQGMIFIDGGKLNYPVPKNAVITARGGVRPLSIFL